MVRWDGTYEVGVSSTLLNRLTIQTYLLGPSKSGRGQKKDPLGRMDIPNVQWKKRKHGTQYEFSVRSPLRTVQVGMDTLSPIQTDKVL